MVSLAPRLIGASVASRAVEDDVECAVRSDANVLITDESGVEKEVVARLIHDRSSRRRAPLVTINCAGILDTRLASELWVHSLGSVTDAHLDKQGKTERGYGRTIFLDGIDDLSGVGQAALLGFLKSSEIQPVGSDPQAASGNVRVIAAATRRLHERVAAGEFRDDLFYRLNTIHIEIPPLLDRLEDMSELVQQFLRHVSA
jgi:transcriptional regulator with GAF, ATPase, and Fis domain